MDCRGVLCVSSILLTLSVLLVAAHVALAEVSTIWDIQAGVRQHLLRISHQLSFLSVVCHSSNTYTVLSCACVLLISFILWHLFTFKRQYHCGNSCRPTLAHAAAYLGWIASSAACK